MTKQVVFFGSSEFSVVVLEKLLSAEGCVLRAVVTTPDKPVGRHLKLTPNPVKVFAQEHNIPVYTSPLSFPSPIIGEGAGGEVLGVVVAYGQILKQEVIDAFNGQIYNIHPSLLPKYRGPSPLQQQILDGVTETGVTIIQLDSQVDHGPIVAQIKDTIHPDDTTQTLGNRLFVTGASLFLSQLCKARPCEAKPQNHSQATFTQKLTRQDGFLEFEEFENSMKIENLKLKISRMHRAFVGWPGVWTTTPSGQRLKLIALKPQILVQFEGKTSQPWPIVV